MPVISTSVSVSTSGTQALTITAGGNYLITAPTFLESQTSYAIGINNGIGPVTINLAGSVVASLGYFGIYQSGYDDPLTLNILSDASIFGGAIVSTASQLTMTNYGYLYGQDSGIYSGAAADSVINHGEIFATAGLAIDLQSGADVVINAGHITGGVDLGAGDDRFYGGGGSILGDVDLSTGNDIIDLRGAQIDGKISGGAGNDVFIVDDVSFDLSEGASMGSDLVKSSVSFQLGANFENLQLLGASDSNGTGNTLANTLTGNAGDNRLHGYAGSDKLYGGVGDDRLFGDTGNDSLYGGISDDAVYGGAGNDVLSGDTGADRLFGAVGRDVMTGDVGTSGGYDDVFIFTRTTDSLNSSLSDRITDFHRGEDKIDLSGIDAKSATAANDAFSFITTAFTNVAGQLRLQTSGTDTFVLGDVNGDSIADFRIILTGNLALTAADFVL